MTDEATPRPKPPKITFRDYAKKLLADNLPIPVPLRWGMDNKGMPVRVGAYDEWVSWAAEQGYTPEQVRTLLAALGRLVRSQVYLRALAAPSSSRHSVDGAVGDAVLPEHREFAAKKQADRAAKNRAQRAAAAGVPKPPAPRPSPAPPPKPPAPLEPPPIAAVQKAPSGPVFRSGASPLSPTEIEARRAAPRAGLKPLKATAS